MEDLLELYKIHGDNNYFGEKVTKTEHMIQCALAAQNEEEPDYIVLACLLHDIGHLLKKDDMNSLGVSNHGKIAHDYLKKIGIEGRVCYLVDKHIDAKRYLVSKDIKFYDKLSEASKKTLEYQGGKMTNKEIENMENDPEIFNILKVRKYDDMGKKENQSIPDIEFFIPLIRKFL